MKELNNDEMFKNKGNITCTRNILLSIINLATKEISGVSGITSEKRSFFKNFFCKNKFNGVKIRFNQSGAILVDVYINIFAGYSVPDVAYRVQENVKNGIASMIEMKTAKVNVHVVNVDFSKEESLDLA